MCHVGVKWALLRQPPASLIEISVQRTRSRAGGLGEEPQNVHIWGGVIQEIKEDCDEDVEATIEMSEDERGLRALVCHLFKAANNVHHATYDPLRTFSHAT